MSRTTLAQRISVLAVAVAVITGLIAGFLSLSLTRTASESGARKELKQLANAAASTANDRPDASTAQVARSFGISASCLARWLRIADREDGNDSAPPKTVDVVEVRELRRRNKQLEQEVEILRRATAYFARDALPK